MKKPRDIKNENNFNYINIETLLILGLIHQYKLALNQIFTIIEIDTLDNEDEKEGKK